MDKIIFSLNERMVSTDMMTLQGYVESCVNELIRGMIGEAIVVRGFTLATYTGMSFSVVAGSPDSLALSDAGQDMRLSSNGTVTPAVGDGTYGRIDLVSISPLAVDGQSETRDFYDAGSIVPAATDKKTSDSVTITLTPGTPASPPTVPSTPGGSLAIAQILVPKSATASTQCTITDVRPVLRTLMDATGLNTEVVNARGSLASLDARIDVKHNNDGTLKGVTVAELSDCAYDPANTTGLTYAILAGHIRVGGTITAVPESTVALTPNMTNYVEADPGTGVVSANTSAFAVSRIPLQVVVTGASSVTTVTDDRAWLVGSGLPVGMVAFFPDVTTCPVGWTELTDMRGRYVVGLQPGGTVNGTQGTYLTDKESRSVGQHTHAVTESAHTHAVSDPTHTHAVSDPTHVHTIPGLSTEAGVLVGAMTNEYLLANPTDNWATAAAATGISISASATGISNTATTTGISNQNAGAVAGTNAPYLQLLACKKS
jgi:hypothetical protein